jgi:hypothetical protein
MQMKSKLASLVVALAISAIAAPTFAQVTVGAHRCMPTKTLSTTR